MRLNKYTQVTRLSTYVTLTAYILCRKETRKQTVDSSNCYC